MQPGIDPSRSKDSRIYGTSAIMRIFPFDITGTGWVSKFGKQHPTEEQIAFALWQAESGISVAAVIRKLGIGEQTFYRWNERLAWHPGPR